jgi:hypothetical protein
MTLSTEAIESVDVVAKVEQIFSSRALFRLLLSSLPSCETTIVRFLIIHFFFLLNFKSSRFVDEETKRQKIQKNHARSQRCCQQ